MLLNHDFLVDEGEQPLSRIIRCRPEHVPARRRQARRRCPTRLAGPPDRDMGHMKTPDEEMAFRSKQEGGSSLPLVTPCRLIQTQDSYDHDFPVDEGEQPLSPIIRC